MKRIRVVAITITHGETINLPENWTIISAVQRLEKIDLIISQEVRSD